MWRIRSWRHSIWTPAEETANPRPVFQVTEGASRTMFSRKSKAKLSLKSGESWAQWKSLRKSRKRRKKINLPCSERILTTHTITVWTWTPKRRTTEGWWTSLSTKPNHPSLVSSMFADNWSHHLLRNSLPETGNDSFQRRWWRIWKDRTLSSLTNSSSRSLQFKWTRS